MKTINWDEMLNIPIEQWRGNGIKLLAASCNSDGEVNSFIAMVNKQRVYGYRKREHLGPPNYTLTGKEKFVLENK